jgi:cell division protein FtsZ
MVTAVAETPRPAERPAVVETPPAQVLGEKREEPAITFGRQPATAASATERAAAADTPVPELRTAERPAAALRVDPPMTPPARTASEAAKQAAQPEKRRAPNLFHRVTGTAAAWARSSTPPEKKEATPPAKPMSQPAAQARLSLDPQDRLAASKTEEDLLDIPAFLRRQAN